MHGTEKRTKIVIGVVVGICLVAIFTSPNIYRTLDYAKHYRQDQLSPQTSQQSADGKPHIPKDMLPPDSDIMVRFKNLSRPGIKQDDPELIQFLRDKVIEPPRPYVRKLSHPLYKTPQAVEVDRILAGKAGGYYVECGAFDGERSSNTLWFEHMKNWTGFLIEMDPSFYLQVRGKNRWCHTANACLSPHPYPIKISWKEMSGGNGQLLDANQTATHQHETLCFPFFSFMLALNITHIDYFSLDVEGQELQVLRTIPFDKIHISVLTVEYLHADKLAILDLMKNQGYDLYKTLDYSNKTIWQWSFDYVFVKTSLAPRKRQKKHKV